MFADEVSGTIDVRMEVTLSQFQGVGSEDIARVGQVVGRAINAVVTRVKSLV